LHLLRPTGRAGDRTDSRYDQGEAESMRRLTALVLMLTTIAPPAMAQAAERATRNLGEEVIRTVVWLVVAGVTFVISFKIIDWTTPGDLKEEIAKGNTAMAIYAGSLAIAIGIIIAQLVS